MLLESAAAGRPACVLVEGQGGSGKTSLLASVRESLSSGSVVMATGDEAEAGLPYGVLDQLGSQLSLVAASRRRQQRYGGDPFATGAVFLQELDRVSRSAPLVLMIDDAHLADSPSLAALTFAARRLLADAVLVVLTAREEGTAELPPGLLRLVNDRGYRINLGGFSTEDVCELSEAVGFGQLSQRAATRLRDHTGGNPLHLRALLSDLTPEQAEAMQTPLPVPRSLALLVLARLAGTSPAARSLAAAAATLGGVSKLHEAAAVAGLDDPHVAADELNQAAILHLSDEPAGVSLRFAHPLVRAAVYNDTGLVTRARLHARAAQVTSGAEVLRHRVLAALRPDPELVADLLAQADDDQVHGRLGVAPAALISASRLSRPGPEADRLFIQAVDLLLLEGDLIGALGHAPVLKGMPPTARRLQVQARMAGLSGRYDEAQALGHQAWDQASDLEPAERDGLAAMLAQIAILQDEGSAAAEWAHRALASGLLPTEVAVGTRATGALGLCNSGRAHDGIKLLGHLPADPHTVPQGQLQLLGMRGLLRMFIDELDSSRADLEQVLPSMNRGLRPHQLTALGGLAEVEYRTGNWDRSSTLAHQLVGLVEDTGQTWLLALAHAECVLVLAARGQWELAERHVQASREALDVLKDRASQAYAVNATVHLAYCRGDLEAVVASARPILAVASGASHEPSGRRPSTHRPW
jgi:ATP/maltotriose-dependent transcriptional regulator MalT